MVVLQRDLEIFKASATQDEEARGSGKRARYPLGHLFDQQYQETHAEEIAALKGGRGREETRVPARCLG